LRQLRPSSWLRGTPSQSMTVPISPSFRRPIQAPPSVLSWTFHHPSSHKGRLFFKPNWPALPLWRMPAVGRSLTDTPTTPLLGPRINALPRLGGAIPLLSVFPLPWQMPLMALALPSLSFRNLVALAILPPQLPPGVQISLASMPSPSLPTLGSPLLGDILILTVLQPGVFHTPSPMRGCLTTPLLLLIVGGTNVTFHSMGGISHSLFHTPSNMGGEHLLHWVVAFHRLVSLLLSLAEQLSLGTTALGGISMRLHRWHLPSVLRVRCCVLCHIRMPGLCRILMSNSPLVSRVSS
jgi:hypothetical protein